MKRHRLLAALALVLVVSASPILAQESKETLRGIPADALGFVYTSRLDQSNEKLMSIFKQLKVPVPGSPLDEAKKTLGTSKGLNLKGSAAVILFAAQKGEIPVPVFVIPIDNYKEFLAQFEVKDAVGISEIKLSIGKKMWVAQKGGHAVLAEAGQREILTKVLGLQKEPIPQFDLAGLNTWLDDNDLAAVVTPQGVKYSVAKIRAGLAGVKPALDKKDPKDSAELARMLAGVEGFLKSVESDVTSLGLAVKLDKTGNLHLDARALFAKGSGLAKASAGLKALEGGPLAGLPQGPFALAMGGPYSEHLMVELIKFGMESIKQTAKASGEELPKEKLEKLEQASSKMMKGDRGMGFVLRGSKEGETLFSGMAATIKVDDAKAYLDRYEKNLSEFNSLYKDLKIFGIQSMEMKKTKIGKANVLEITQKMDMAKFAKDPAQKKLMEAMMGPGGKITASLAALDATTVMMIYQPAAAMKGILNAKKTASLKDDPKVAATLALLPKGSQWVLLVDPKGMMDVVKQWAKSMAPTPVNIPDFPQTPPVGVGARLSETGLIIHVVAPAQVLEGIGKLVGKKNEL